MRVTHNYADDVVYSAGFQGKPATSLTSVGRDTPLAAIVVTLVAIYAYKTNTCADLKEVGIFEEGGGGGRSPYESLHLQNSDPLK